jgi:pilus assembly protein CpaB
MNWKTWAPLVIAIALGLVAAKVARDVIGKKKSVDTGPKSVLVVVAKDDIPPGQELKDEDLVASKIAGDTLPQGAYVKADELFGRVTQAPIVKGQAVLESLLATRGSGAGLQALVPDGMRAITIEVSESSGVAGLLVPGCHVDVLTTIADISNQPIAKTVVQNVRVTAVGQKVTKNPGEDKEISRTVTLIATPPEAEQLELLASTGRLRLVLRGTQDNKPITDKGMRLTDVRGDPKIDPKLPGFLPVPNAPKEKPTPRTVIVIRGGVETNVPILDSNEPAAATADTPQGLITH